MLSASAGGVGFGLPRVDSAECCGFPGHRVRLRNMAECCSFPGHAFGLGCVLGNGPKNGFYSGCWLEYSAERALYVMWRWHVLHSNRYLGQKNTIKSKFSCAIDLYPSIVQICNTPLRQKKKHVFVRCRPLPLICPNSCEKTHTPKPNAPASYPLQQCACRTEATTIGAFSLHFFHMGSPLGGTRLSCRRFNSARTHRVVHVLLPLWADYAL